MFPKEKNKNVHDGHDRNRLREINRLVGSLVRQIIDETVSLVR